MSKKVKLKLLVGVREVHVSTYPIEIDVTGIPAEGRPLHVHNWLLRERAIKRAMEIVESGEIEAIGFEYSHTMEPHTWTLENNHE